MPLRKLKNGLLNFFSNRYQNASIGLVLENALQFLNKDTVEEMRQKSLNFRNNNGGFCDRAGNSDLYYSLFGMFVGNALQINNTNENLRKYLQSAGIVKNMDGVNAYCLSIISSVSGYVDKKTEEIKQQIKKRLLENLQHPDYNLFLGILSLFYQRKYFTILKILRKIKIDPKEKWPCPVIAANAVVIKASGKASNDLEKRIMEFYRGDGSFGALKNSPLGDLLSTAVALFALKFIGADIRSIKPDCLSFVDSLYMDGSFAATSFDSETDIEYTFYGMLALGSLA